MAKVGTDTANIVAISPEQLVEVHPQFTRLWNSGQHEAALRLLNQHGGATFHTGGDGAFEVMVPKAEESAGYIAPYATPSFASHAVGNPMGMVPQIALGAVVLGGLGFVGYRWNQRQQLMALLAANPDTLVLGTPEALASEEMPIFSNISVEAAYSSILDRMPEPEVMQPAFDFLEEHLPEDVRKEGGEFAQSLWEAGKSWWESE